MDGAQQPSPGALPGAQPGPAGASPPPAGAGGNLLGLLGKAHSQAKAMFDQTSKAVAHIDYMKKQMQTLADKGAALSPEDVIDSAGKIIARGDVSPQEMTSALASMPEGGQALQGWVQAHLQRYQQMEMMAKINHGIMQHEMGMSALRHITGLMGAGGASMAGEPGPSQAATGPGDLGPDSPVSGNG